MPNLQIRQPNQPPSTLPLAAGRYRIGAAADALVHVDGVPETAIELAVGQTGLTTLQARLPLRIAGQPFVAGVPRHLRPGEEVVIAGVVVLIQKDTQSPQGTAALAKNILGSLVEGEISNALPGIVWLTGPDLGKRVDLTEDIAFIGRGNGCEVRIRDRLVSRQHAKIVADEETTRLVDLNSSNGVWVDGLRVRGDLALKGGELIQIGTTLLAYEAGNVPAPTPKCTPETPPERLVSPMPEPAGPEAASSAPDSDKADASPEVEPKVRVRSEWLLALAGLIALGLAGAVVAIVLT
jgi:hypothetical protein